MPIGPHIFIHIEDALSECFEFHNELDKFLTRCGLSQKRLNDARMLAEQRNTKYANAPKRYVVEEIISKIRTGEKGDDQFISQLIDGLCRTNFPNAKPKGLAAIDKLKIEREHDRVENENRRKREKIDQDADKEKRQEQNFAIKRTVRMQFNERFLGLYQQDNPQQRGYALEGFLNDFFSFEDLNPRTSFRVNREQIDGSFSWSNSTYLVEAKWNKNPICGADFGAFIYKIQGKTANTRGLFISINGYSSNAIECLNGKGDLRFVCIDGTHLHRTTEPGWSIKKLLEIIWRHADETGEAYLPVGSPRFQSKC